VSVLWIVEKAKAQAPTLAASLMGDFAVRVFASLESLARLVRVARGQRPDLLLVDLEDVTGGERRLVELVDAHLPATPVAVVAPAGATREAAPPWRSLVRLTRPLDALGLGAALDELIRGFGAGRGRHLRYRDVQLDCERHQCTVLPGDEPVSLPLKEAQLLKLFLERPGVCLSRAEIQGAIWEDVTVTPRTIDSHVSRLRKRLQDAEAQIESVYGGGYVLK